MSSDKECESTNAGLWRRAVPGVCAALAVAAPAAVILAGPASASELPPPTGLHLTRASQHAFSVRWSPVTGASEYGIRVFHDGDLLQQFDVRKDKASIAGLRPGTPYQVFVRTNQAGSPAVITVITPRALTFGQQVAAFSRTLVGDPYEYGGSGPDAFDCSGLAQYVYRHYGRRLPRTADDQYHYLRHVSDPKPGDLVFFVSGGSAYHVGVYEGSGTMVAAATPAEGVVYQRLWTTAVVYGAP